VYSWIAAADAAQFLKIVGLLRTAIQRGGKRQRRGGIRSASCRGEAYFIAVPNTFTLIAGNWA
jgi:hypothetical protein